MDESNEEEACFFLDGYDMMMIARICETVLATVPDDAVGSNNHVRLTRIVMNLRNALGMDPMETLN